MNSTNRKKLSEYTMIGVMKRLFLAGIGLISFIHEDLESYVDKLEDRGVLTKNNIVDNVHRKRHGLNNNFTNEKTFISRKSDEVISKLGLPNRTDLNKLNQKISLLEIKINDLLKKKI